MDLFAPGFICILTVFYFFAWLCLCQWTLRLASGFCYYRVYCSNHLCKYNVCLNIINSSLETNSLRKNFLHLASNNLELIVCYMHSNHKQEHLEDYRTWRKKRKWEVGLSSTSFQLPAGLWTQFPILSELPFFSFQKIWRYVSFRKPWKKAVYLPFINKTISI